MRKSIIQLVWIAAMWTLGSTAALAQDVGAVATGDWSTPSIWTSDAVPGSSNNVYIGSTYPTGSAGIVTVTVSSAESAGNVYLGYNNSGGQEGTLDLTAGVLTIANSLYIGFSNGAIGTISESGGSFTAPNVYVYNGNSLTLGVNDAVSNLNLTGSSSATTAAMGNVTANASVDLGSTLNLGANLSLSINLDVERSSIVNMNGNNISASTIYLGWFDNQAVTLDRGTTPGSLAATNLLVGSNTLNLIAADAVSNLYLSNATVTTAATGNVTANVSVDSSSTLNLGANLSLSGTLDVERSSIVNMNGNNISASSIYLGWFDGQAVTLDRGTTPGSLAATNLLVGSNTLNLVAADAASNLFLSNATVTTAVTGNVTANASVDSSSTLNLGANLSLSSGLDVERSSIVNMNGNNISASSIYVGWFDGQAVTLDRGTTPGSLTATNLLVGSNTLNLIAADAVSNLYLSNATVTTAATGNVTANVSVDSSSTLNLGANLSLSSGLDVERSSIVNMNGNNISASSIYVGWFDGQAVTLDRGTTPGSLTATNLFVGSNTLNLIAADAVTNLNLSNAAIVTTAATGNVAANVNVSSGSTLNLGANLSLSGSVDVENTGSTVNGHGFGITSNAIYAGYFDHQAVSFTNLGTVTTNALYMDAGSTMTLHGGDVVNSLISLTGGSVLTVQQTNGMGLTLNGTSLSSLTIDPSQMDLIFNLNTAPNWDFRWADPSGGTWVSTIDGMINSGQIVVTAPQGYEVIDQGGYTYVEGLYGSAVPEPASLVLACIASVGVAIAVRWKRRRAGST